MCHNIAISSFLSQVCDRTQRVCCIQNTQHRALNSITAHFDSSVVLRRKQIFSVPLWITQAGAGSNSGFVVRVSQWRNSEKFQMSASCLGPLCNVTLCPIVQRLNTLQTPPFDIHWSSLVTSRSSTQFSRPGAE